MGYPGPDGARNVMAVIVSDASTRMFLVKEATHPWPKTGVFPEW